MFPYLLKYHYWKQHGCIFLLLLTFLRSVDAKESGYAEGVPPGAGQLTEEIEWFTAGRDELGHTIEYCGQAAQNGKLILTASNGFFSRGIVAKGIAKYRDVANGWPTDYSTSGKRKGHPLLIDRDYEYLDNWKSSEQTLRWHIWFPETGSLQVLPHLEPVVDREALIEVRLGGQIRRTKAEDLKKGLNFNVTSTGRQSLIFRKITKNGKAVGRLYTIDVFGPAVRRAKLLRARWRPGAVHGKYQSSEVETTCMWVMVSRSESDCSSYSPITTPFGYYGCSFGADRRAMPGINFSMWTKTDQPLEQYAHLVAVGSPKAEFSGFGHEGTGVKPRGWEPLHARPSEVVLALRVERGEKYDTFYGYFLDPETGDWRLYCAGRKWTGKTGTRKQKRKVLWPGSFVEVPGNSSRQRSGDLVRNVLRKGWVLDDKGQWHRLNILFGGKAEHANKTWGVNENGWFSFKMGGMEHFTTKKTEIRLPVKFMQEKLPEFLSPSKVKQLYQLPATFGAITVQTGNTGARLNMVLKDVGTNASAIVYYGEKDCLTYAPRKLHGTERKSSVLTKNNVWPKLVNMGRVKNGLNTVVLSGLKPSTKYYFRVLVNNDQGRTWTLETHSFTTK